jgi:vitamin B12 transporter
MTFGDRFRVPSSNYGLALGLAGWCAVSFQPAAAQELAGTVVELPPLVVEGATRAKPKAKETSKTGKTTGDGAVPAATSPEMAEPLQQSLSDNFTGDGSVNTSVEGGVRADSIGTAVSVVTREEIQAQQSRHAVEVLRGLPAVSVSQQGGAESNQTLVPIDGVEVNSGIDGVYDFANLASDDIARIEVLRGPQSGLYGSGALGGVINIVTNSGKGPARVVVEGEGGSFNARGGRAGVSGGTDTAWGAFMVSSRHGNGFNISPQGGERDGGDLKTLSMKAGVRPSENLTVRGAFHASRLDTEYDDFSSNLPGFQRAIDAPFMSLNDMWSGRLDAELALFNDAWTQQVFVTRSNRDFNDQSFSVSQLIDEATTYGYKTTVRIGPKEGGPVRHYVTGLIERREETFEQPTSANFHAARDRLSYVGEVRGAYFGLFNLGASLRRDDNETFDDTTDWRIDGSFKVPSTPFRLHSSYGTGTKLPSFAELYGTFFRYTPNPDLRPERSKGWDVGVETTFLSGRGVVDVTYFNTNLTNEITEDFSVFPLIRSVNLNGESKLQGIEVSGRIQVLPGVLVGTAYTWRDARDDQDLRELRRPEHQARFDIDWRLAHDRARLNLGVIYNGQMEDLGFLAGPPFSQRVALNCRPGLSFSDEWKTFLTRTTRRFSVMRRQVLCGRALETRSASVGLRIVDIGMGDTTRHG